MSGPEIARWRKKAEGMHSTGRNLELEIGKVPVAKGVGWPEEEKV